MAFAEDVVEEPVVAVQNSLFIEPIPPAADATDVAVTGN